MPLRPRQLIFVQEYVKSRNATDAAMKAGYSPKTAYAMGAENLKKPQIKKEIDKGLAKLAVKTEITAERVIKRIAEIAFDSKTARNSDIMKGCELLGKHFKLFTDVQEISGKDGGPQVVLVMPANKSEAKEEG